MASPDPPTDNRQELEPTPEESRYELQSILGQLHGLLSKVFEYPEQWRLADLSESLGVAYRDIGEAFGRVQAALNTGIHDLRLKDLGLAGDQMAPKKQGFRDALRRFFSPIANNVPPFFGALGPALRWGGIIVGSLAREIPGGEVIKEFIEVVAAAREQWLESRRPPPARES
jgi:hypothetical protein